MRLAARCKTNLFLEVTRRRPDGFHELDTVFCALELHDDLELEALPCPTGACGASGSIELAVEGDATVPADATNLVWRAAVALREAAGRPELGARMRITKRIPAGGGLGGGSADAGAALVGLDRLWGTGLGPARLEQVAATLGSDVAFFVRGGLQRGRGRGEQLDALAPPPRALDLVLVFPPFGCPTPQVYGALRPFLPGAPDAPPVRGPEPLLLSLARGDVEGVARALWNRLEPAAEACFPPLRALRLELAADPRALGALLSGSGSTLLAITRTQDDAQALARDLAAIGLRTVVTRTAAAATVGAAPA